MTLRRKLFAGGVLLLLVGGIVGYFAFRRLYLPSYRSVRDGVLYRSGQPRGPGLDYLKATGIRTIVCLRNPDREDVEMERAFAAENGIKHVQMSLGTDGGDIEGAAETFFALVDDKANWPILVHCSLGHERSGVLSALFRMEYDGWTPEAALDEAERLGMEDDSQVLAVEYLRHYRRRDKAD